MYIHSDFLVKGHHYVQFDVPADIWCQCYIAESRKQCKLFFFDWWVKSSCVEGTNGEWYVSAIKFVLTILICVRFGPTKVPPTLGTSAGFRIKPSLVLAGTNDDLDGEEFNSGALTLVRLHCLSILVDGCNESEVTTPSVTLFCLGRPRSLCYSRNYTCKATSWAMGGRGCSHLTLVKHDTNPPPIIHITLNLLLSQFWACNSIISAIKYCFNWYALL